MRKIALRGLIGQKRSTLLLWSVVALAFTFLVLSTTLITSLQKTDEIQRSETYGSWQVLVADSSLTGADYSSDAALELTNEKVNELFSAADSSVLLPMIKVSGVDYFSGDNEYYLTPYSDIFKEMGNFTLKEGEWPKAKNEIVLEYAKLSSLGLSIGDSFTVINQLNFPTIEDYSARKHELMELAKQDAINDGLKIFREKRWGEFMGDWNNFFVHYPVQQKGNPLYMALADDAHPEGQIIPFEEMTEEQFIKVYTVYVSGTIHNSIDFSTYMRPHMTEEEIEFFFGLTADLIGYEDLNIRVSLSTDNIIINIPYTYTICGVVDTFSDRWDTGMLPLPSGFITEENYGVYLNGIGKVLEKYDKYAFIDYEKLLFLSNDKNSSARELWNKISSAVNENSSALIIENFEMEEPHDLTELRLNRFAYPSTSEGSGRTLTLVTVILFVTTVCAVFQIFFTQMRKRMRRIILMKSIGAESRQIGFMLLWEFIYFLISTLPVGILLGLGGAYLTTFALEKSQARDIIYTVDPVILIFAVFAGTLALFIGMMIPSIMAIGVPLTGRTARKKPLAPPKKEVQQNFLNVTLRGLYANKSRTLGNAALCLFMMLIMTLCIFIGFRFMTPYRETVQRNSRPDYFLQLPYSVSDRQLPEYLKELEELGVCESIDVQRTAEDSILDASVESVLLDAAFGNSLITAQNSYGDPFSGYPMKLYAISSESEFFEKYSASATYGSVDKENFEAGKEVILFIPLYKDTDNTDNSGTGYGWEKVDSSGIDTTYYKEYRNVYDKDTGISVGDYITLGASTRYFGGAGFTHKLETEKVKVSAIIHYFPDEGIWPISGSDEGYQIICSSSLATHLLPNSMRTRSSNEIRALKVMYLSTGYGTTDFYITAKEGISKYDIDTKLLVYARSKYMDIEFYHESNSKLLQDGINNILLVCLLGLTAVLLALLIFANTISSDIEQERNKIGILQSLGVSNKQLIKRQLYIGLAVSGAAVFAANVLLWGFVALYALLSDAVLGNLLWGYPWWLHFISCIVLAAIITALYVAPMHGIRRYLPIENIKTRK